MAFAPPPGPPPPSVPEGWKAQFDDRYKQWFFIDLSTGKSQWEPPTATPPAPPPSEPIHAPPTDAPPPSYESSGPANPAALAGAAASDKKQPFSSNNPYGHASGPDGPSGSTLDSDARLAAQLQAEEDARARESHSPAQPQQQKGDYGAAADYYANAARPQASSASPVPPAETKSRSKGFLSKLMGKSSSSSSSHSPAGYGYGRPAPPPPQQGFYPPQPQGYAQPGHYGGYPQQPGYGGYPPPHGGYYQQQQPPQRRPGMGMGGMAGAAALGVGGGLIGGALLADAIDDHDDYGGGDFGGGDDFGGDF
ncbi:hypothetical protein BJX96DRAFT_48930 [Aspergillus floccosus]